MDIFWASLAFSLDLHFKMLSKSIFETLGVKYPKYQYLDTAPITV
jgi:hypothetical protein